LNKTNKTNYFVEEMAYPVKYNNMPFDYYNIWVKNAGETDFEGNATLESLTKEYGLIIWKHCYPVSLINPAKDSSSIEMDEKTLSVYKLQYQALKEKMKSFDNTRFIVWTGATHVANLTTEEQALRMKEFVNWVKNEWDEKGDNIFIWDFYELETEGGIYLKDENASNASNSHPNVAFSAKAAVCFAQRIVDVMSGKGDITSITGK
jgi:hypothetical protein